MAKFKNNFIVKPITDIIEVIVKILLLNQSDKKRIAQMYSRNYKLFYNLC